MQGSGQPAERRVQWYHPGEVVVVARLPAEIRQPRQVHSRIRQALPAAIRRALTSETRSFSFTAPGRPTLVFAFCALGDGVSARAVKDVVEAVHVQAETRGDVDLLGAMPHWHTRAHELYGGGSPGSFPRPVYGDQVPAGLTSRVYQPVQSSFDLIGEVDAPVPVAVLDTVPDLDTALEQGKRFAARANNRQLEDTVAWLRTYADNHPGYGEEHARVAQRHSAFASQQLQGGEQAPYPMADHGLFVAGLIHGLAPRAPITLAPVLDSFGVGDLSTLLLALQRLVDNKAAADPLVINLSLGFLPHPARLPAAWYGLRRPHDPAFVHAEEMFDPARDERWVAGNRGSVGRTVDLLQIGLQELGTYLSLNNCLVVAAAGNDSLAQVEAHQARMEPRLPARFETVLGVAATTSNPGEAARYSNLGDERELGDHVATFGGNASDALEPEDGVIGIYSSDDFPDQRTNETGWAFWSGTSFATGIVSGIAANFWAVARKKQPDVHASQILSDLHRQARDVGPYVPALRTPSIQVRGRWGGRG